MIKKTITYTDYNGCTRTEDFYFNLTKAELINMEFSVKGGFSEYVQSLISNQDSKEIIHIFQDIILKSYGKKSEDGRRFVKSQELCDEFMECPAYSELYMELANNSDAGAAFISGLIPNDLSAQVEKKDLKALAAEKLGITATATA